GKLDSSGKTNDMYVVNTFHDTDSGELTDFGPYESVRNLTNLTDLNISDDDKVTFEGNESEFYYQGELENQPLPWNVSITYLLDGKKIDPSDLAGKSGEVEIQIETEKNDSVDSTFFNYYLQQISVTLDPEKFDNIHAPKGTKANEGKNQQITFSVMPEEEDDLIITADVEEFELDPIEINALPANIAMDDSDFGSMTGEFKSLSYAIGELHSGTEQLNDGISEVNDGTSELSNGSSDYWESIQSLDSQSDELINGSSQIKDALNQMNEKVNQDFDMPDLSEFADIPDAVHDFTDGLRVTADGFKTLKEQYEAAMENLDDPLDELEDVELSDEEMEALIQALEESDVDDETIQKLKQMKKATEQIQETFDQEEVQRMLTEIPE